jgi:[protein-PII] uridylyltransferase
LRLSIPFRMTDPLSQLEARTGQIDELVKGTFPAIPGLALAAVGGYGRRELFPYSDIDLLFLAPDEAARDQLREPLAPYLRSLWDSGLRISQSVRTPEECLQFDSRNVELYISLLDRRFLAGDESVYARIAAMKPRSDLLGHLTRLTRDRHSKFQNTIYHLEPNIKDGPGGLRDLQTLRWAQKLGEPAPPDELRAPRDFLYDVRWRLHNLSGRDNNTLDFAMQDQVDPADPAGLMREYFRGARAILRACGNLLDRSERRTSTLFARFRDRTARLSNADFSVVRERVHLRVPQQASHDPELIDRLFIFVARHGIPLAPDAQDRLLAHLPPMKTQWAALREILSLPYADLALREMHAAGVLQTIFPEFRHLDSLVVRDFYHRYTVDEHTLVTIHTLAELKRAGKPRPESTASGFAGLMAEAPPIAVLYLSLLFHDVGKGTGEDHTIASARLAGEMFERIGLPEEDRVMVRFLIGAHLEMSAAMSSRDVHDPAVAHDMAKRIGTVERLKYLTLLTYADISAVNPEALTPWRATLLWNLYIATYRALTSELDTDRLEARSYGSPERESFLDGLPVRYLRTRTEAEIEMHMRMAKEDTAVRIDRDNEVYRLTVVASDRPRLFASIAGALASFGMNIVKAEAFSNRHGVIVDTFHFVDPVRTLELNPGEDEALQKTVKRTIRGELDVGTLLKRRPVKKQPSHHMRIPFRVAVDNSASENSTLVEITAEDRPGLLYTIASAISDEGCNIEVVLIDTEAHRAIDVFYITRGGRKLTDSECRSVSVRLDSQ